MGLALLRPCGLGGMDIRASALYVARWMRPVVIGAGLIGMDMETSTHTLAAETGACWSWWPADGSGDVVQDIPDLLTPVLARDCAGDSGMEW